MHRDADPQGGHWPASSELPRSPWSWIRLRLDFSGWLEYPRVSFFCAWVLSSPIRSLSVLSACFWFLLLGSSLVPYSVNVTMSVSPRADTFLGVLSWATLAHFKRSHLCLQAWGLPNSPPPHLHTTPLVTTTKGSALCYSMQERKKKKEGTLTNTFACTRLLNLFECSLQS